MCANLDTSEIKSWSLDYEMQCHTVSSVKFDLFRLNIGCFLKRCFINVKKNARKNEDDCLFRSV